MKRPIIFAISLALLVASATAAEFHVAPNGNDANPGTQAAPLRTIQRAAELAQPGDTITVHDNQTATLTVSLPGSAATE